MAHGVYQKRLYFYSIRCARIKSGAFEKTLVVFNKTSVLSEILDTQPLQQLSQQQLTYYFREMQEKVSIFNIKIHH